MFDFTDHEFYQSIKDYSVIMVFGAGKNGRVEYRRCKRLKKDISCYLVDKSSKMGLVIDGTPVKQLDDISPSEKQEGLVIVGRSYANHQETAQLLREHGFWHIIRGSAQVPTFYDVIKDYSTIMIFGVHGGCRWECRSCKENFKKDVSCYLVDQGAEADLAIDGVPVRRIDDISPNEKQESLVIDGMSYANHQKTVQMFQEHGFRHIVPGNGQQTIQLSKEHIAALKEIFGSALLLQVPSLEREKACSMKIYAVTSANNFHKAKRRWDSKYIEYIQAGAALTKERLCALTDDTGDNISQYNDCLNEMTAAYWIAKNDVQHEYVGLYHYSRGMDLNDRQLEWIAEHGIDVVLKTPSVYRYSRLSMVDIRIYGALGRYAPDYEDATGWYLKNCLFFQGNIEIAKREIFKEYCEWAFSIMEGMGKMYPDVLKAPRYFGYMAEHLLNIWHLKNAHRFRIAIAPVRPM